MPGAGLSVRLSVRSSLLLAPSIIPIHTANAIKRIAAPAIIPIVIYFFFI
jgi:hypothetical protein